MFCMTTATGAVKKRRGKGGIYYCYCQYNYKFYFDLKRSLVENPFGDPCVHVWLNPRLLLNALLWHERMGHLAG